MVFIAWFLWILIWGLAGYFTVRAIKTHIEIKRVEKAMAAYYQHQRLMMTARIFDNAASGLSDHFIDNLSKKGDLA